VDELGTQAVAAENSSPDVVNRPRRQVSWNSTHERSRRRSARPAGQRLAGMPRLVRLGSVASGAAAVGLLAAACSGGSGYGSSYGVGRTTSAGPATTAVVGIRASSLGQTLVDGQGSTLYFFEADKAGRSECNGACTAAWPPYLGGSTVTAGTGVTAALLSTITRADGGRQVTYGGHPLYRYAGDNAPGDLTGQGLDQFGAKWYVLGPSGSEIGVR
jgi:predicted lipoprotein with Yx(FWY)xxD motif